MNTTVYMPLMVDLKQVVVFGGERGEGLQKTEKMAVFADELLVVPESEEAPAEIRLPAGPLERVPESLQLEEPRRIPVADAPARPGTITGHLAHDPTFVTSDLEDDELNRRIRAECDNRNILCNIIDEKPLCNTWLMSVIDTPNMIAGLSTKGGCAFYAQRTRMELEGVFQARSAVSKLLTELRSGLRDDQCTFCTLDVVYRDHRFQQALKRDRWKRARERGEQIAGALPADYHVREHGVETLRSNGREPSRSRPPTGTR